MQSINLDKEWLYNEYIVLEKDAPRISKENNISKSLIYTNLKKYDIKIRSATRDITNQKFGHLTPLYITKRVNRRTFWYCLCDCGNPKGREVTLSDLQTKKIYSCGCTKYKNYYDIDPDWWSNVKSKAKSRGLEFNITKEFIWELYIKQDKKCYFTDCVINFPKRRNNFLIEANNGTLSIDRIDSAIGYLESNVILVHKTVNVVKNCLYNEDFINICNLISKKHYRKQIYDISENHHAFDIAERKANEALKNE